MEACPHPCHRRGFVVGMQLPVSVPIDGRGNRLAPETRLKDRQRNPAGDQPGRVSMAEVVNSRTLRQTDSVDSVDSVRGRLPPVGVDDAECRTPPSGAVKIRPVGCRPLHRRWKSSTCSGVRTGVRRDFLVLGHTEEGPALATSFPSTLHTGAGRCETHIKSRGRSAVISPHLRPVLPRPSMMSTASTRTCASTARVPRGPGRPRRPRCRRLWAVAGARTDGSHAEPGSASTADRALLQNRPCSGAATTPNDCA